LIGDDQYTIRVPGEKQGALRAHLKEHGIGSEIYYSAIRSSISPGPNTSANWSYIAVNGERPRASCHSIQDVVSSH
jgi:hypothetical protein